MGSSILLDMVIGTIGQGMLQEEESLKVDEGRQMWNK
jgi:hypothetical protein